MKVRIKKIDPTIETVIPKKQKVGDCGFDLTATSHEFKEGAGGIKLQVYGTNLAVEIPEGFVGVLVPRSSLTKTNLTMGNSIGIIDQNYRGELKFKFKIDSNARPTKEGSYNVGDRIGQLLVIPMPDIELELSDTLSDTVRGDKSFGSSGR